MPIWEQYQPLLGAPHLTQEAWPTPTSFTLTASSETQRASWCVKEQLKLRGRALMLLGAHGQEKEKNSQEFGMTEKSWRGRVVMVAQQCGCT